MYLVELILIGIALVSSILSSSIDLAFVAGLWRQTVILITL